MGWSCIGCSKKSGNEIENKTEVEEREERGGGDSAAGFASTTDLEALSEQQLVEKVRSTYEDFLKCQGLGGASFSRGDFEEKFTKYVACERAYLKKLGIDHNDTEKVESVLDPILKGIGTGSAAGTSSASENMSEDGSHSSNKGNAQEQDGTQGTPASTLETRKVLNFPRSEGTGR